MKKITVKKQLVDFMIANGNDFRYTDVVKAILRINRGKDYVYTREDRGYYATNLTLSMSIYGPGRQGYLVNGMGDCGLYKNKNGRWSAKYFTEEEMLTNAIEKQVAKLVRQTQNAEFVYRDRYSRYVDTKPNYNSYTDYTSYIRKEYFNEIETAKEICIKKIKKATIKLA